MVFFFKFLNFCTPQFSHINETAPLTILNPTVSTISPPISTQPQFASVSTPIRHQTQSQFNTGAGDSPARNHLPAIIVNEVSSEHQYQSSPSQYLSPKFVSNVNDIMVNSNQINDSNNNSFVKQPNPIIRNRANIQTMPRNAVSSQHGDIQSFEINVNSLQVSNPAHNHEQPQPSHYSSQTTLQETLLAQEQTNNQPEMYKVVLQKFHESVRKWLKKLPKSTFLDPD